MMSDRMHTDHVPLEDVLRGVDGSMPDDARDRVRMRVMAGIDTEGRFQRARMLFGRSVAAFAASATLLAGTGYAAANSLPGDPLYALKRAAEEIRVVFSSDAQQGEALMDLTRERTREIRRLVEDEAAQDDIEAAAGRFGEAAGRAVESQPDTESAEQTRKQIQDDVAEEPASVQRQVEDQMPTPDPAPTPKSNAQPTPDPTPEPAPGSSQAPVPPGPQYQGEGSGPPSVDDQAPGTPDSDSGVSGSGR